MEGRGNWVTGAIGAALAVAIGAAGSHAFKDAGDLRGAELMDTASRYLMWHALGLILLTLRPGRFRWAGRLLIAGTVLFSGTLVLLAFGSPRWVGAVTPFGGLLLILGWIVVAVEALRSGRQPSN